MSQLNFKAIGTSWKIDLYQKIGEIKEAKLFDTIKRRIEVFENDYSRFRENSLITQISKEESRGKTFKLPADANEMISLYHKLYNLTDGLMTPLIGNLLSDAGYDAEYSLVAKERLMSPPTWEESMEYNHPNLLVKEPVLLDFGAAGKGYIIDIIGKLLEDNSVYEYCIDAGGDILHKGKPIRVGLENPKDTTEVIGVYNLGDGSICGSAGNRRAWDRFTHIMNPKTLESSSDISAIWVIAKTAMLADAMTTCLFFVPAYKLMDEYEFEYVILFKDFSIEKSAGFEAEFFA
ncbi:MAG: FAD:protein FMN transferase [bacterium]